MLRPRWTMLSLIVALAGCATSPAPAGDCREPDPAVSTPTGTQDKTRDPLAGFDAEVGAMMKAYEIPGLAVAVVKDGEVVLSKGYGVQAMGEDAKVDADTVFAIASNTKAFSATAVALLEHEGKLNWDDRVVDHLPQLKLWDEYTTREIRVRDLLSHRSGLATWAGDLSWIGSSTTTEAVMAKLRHVHADHGLRQRFGYCNLTFMVAGELVRAKTGKTWDEFLRERVLEPIGMDRTTTRVGGLEGQENVATPHMQVGDEWRKIPYLDVDSVGAAASINSSVADMAKWLQLQLAAGKHGDVQLLPQEVVLELRHAVTTLPMPHDDIYDPPRHFNAYGLGWFLADYRGQLIVTHGGGLPGMTSRVTMVPDAGFGLVVLTNSESPASALISHALVDRFLGAPDKDYLSIAQARAAEREAARSEDAAVVDAAEPKSASAPPKRLAGSYRNPLLGRAEVSVAEDVVRLDLPDHGGLDCPLVHTSGDRYECVWSDPIFERSTVTFELRKGRARSLRFQVRPSFVDPLEYRFER